MDHPHPAAPFIYIALIVLLFEFQEQLQFPTTIRLLENSVCQRYYAELGRVDLPVGEALCKIGPVQQHLAMVRGWYSALGMLPVLVLGPAFGHLTDTIGRRFVLGLVTVGIAACIAWVYVVCAFWSSIPTELVWLAGLLRIIGGGPYMAITLHATIAADLCDDDTRGQVMYYLFCSKLAVELLVPQLASLLLLHSLWLPYLLGGLALLATLPIVKIMSESLPHQTTVDYGQLLQVVHPRRLHAYKGILKTPGVIPGLATAFLVQMRYNALQILPPYASVRFGWTIAQTTRLLSIIPGISLVIYLTLPSLTEYLRTRQCSVSKINLTVTRLSCVALVAGTVTIFTLPSIGGLIVGLIVLSAGFNTRVPILVALASYIDGAKNMAQLYTLMSVIEALAHVVGSPLIEMIWAAAVGMGSQWLVLPGSFS
ncbi:major facilitator superfamily domain-containing protein [Ilyonectria robusta]|uniref:major facilitator superfamily domain-containing protein n=1 Tax=Ilyonectria robusta TaxID=1079257 RepID=UPI001E8D2794|nr:major facilitator superfamily domain-containing protein [Ilyonectria robusta]KAH8684038.1 major facilitator superfamily domain-containing protein [Ilyonectria robusta]